MIQKYKETGTNFWRISIKNENVEKMLELDGTQYLKVFGTKAGKIQFLEPYRPESGVTKFLGGDLKSNYLQLIRVLRWAIELGRI